MPTQPRRLALELEILRQPDDQTCGPTCLHALYRYYGEERELEDVVREVPQLEGGGTLAVNLAIHALRRGYRALVYTYNLAVFDPSWFESSECDIAERLRAQRDEKGDARVAGATASYLEFLELGGELAMEDLSVGLLRRWLGEGRPVLTGLSATFLYRSRREYGYPKLVEDDVRGQPQGHFVVLSGWDEDERTVRVADPLESHPHFRRHIYWLPVQRVINAILLGVLTYDANLLVLEPPEDAA